MPSLFTHAVVGAGLSAFAPDRFRRVKLAVVLAVAAAVPDLDVLAFRFDIPYSHPLGHRGFSHSLLYASLTAGIICVWFARGTSLVSRSRAGLLLVAFLACASHGLLDACTDAGLGVGFFIPFSDARYFFPWRPILTSSLSIRKFFTADGLAILQNEIAWVWLPVGLLVVLTFLVRRCGVFRRRGFAR